MNHPVKITVVGSLNMDLVVRTQQMPAPGETVFGSSFITAPGGKGANQAAAAARLDAQVAMVGKLGTVSFANELKTNLTGYGVDCSFVTLQEGISSGTALIIVDDHGQNTIVVVPGANMRLTPDDVTLAKGQVVSAKVLLLQLEVPLESVIKAAEIGHAHGVTVILNPAPAPLRNLPQELLSNVDILIPNESEATRLTGISVLDEASAQEAASHLHQSGIETVIITLGERGAYLSTQRQEVLIPAFHVNPVDTTAAGDAFVGGLAVGLAEGKQLIDAVLWGNACGALATTKLGAMPSLPDRQAVEALLAQNP